MNDREKVLQRMEDDRQRAYQVLELLLDRIVQAERGEIPFTMIFDVSFMKKCVPSYGVIPVIWTVDDIRDRYPKGVSDELLYQELKLILNYLQDAMIKSGREVIRELMPNKSETKM